MKALTAQLLCGLVLCCTAMGWATATADAEFAMANPFLNGEQQVDDDAAGAELEMRSERFRLEREAISAGASAGAEVVAQLPSILFVETASDATVTAAAAAAAATKPVAAAAAPAPAAAKAAAPVTVASAAAPVVAAPALVEASSVAPPQPPAKAPFMPGWDENSVPDPPAAAAVKPLPPPPAVSLDTLKMAAEAPVAASVPASKAESEVADVSEDEASDLLAQVSAVIAGDVPARSAAGNHRFRALHAARQQHHARRRAAAARNAPGYGAPGVRDRKKKSHKKHHRHNRKHHARNHRSRHHHKRAEAEEEFPRFAVKTESDLVAEARARAASLLSHEQHSAEESLHSMNSEYEGTAATAAAAAAEEAPVAAASADAANTAEAVRAKRNEYAKHSRAMEEHLHHRFASVHAAAEADTETEEHADAETDAEEGAEHENASEEEGEADADADAQAQADAETEAQLELEAEAEAEAKAKAEAAAKAKAAAAAEAAKKATAALAASSNAQKALLGARFAQTGLKARHRQRMRAGVNAAPGYGPPLHAPPDTHGSPPVMSSTVDLPLNRPPTPNYFYPPSANPPPAAIQTPRLPSLNPNPAPFAPQFPNADAYRSHQMNPYGQFQQIAPPMQREPAASLYPPYSSVPNFEQPAPRSGLQIELPEPAGGAPSLVEWAAAVHRNKHFDAAQPAAPADRPIAQFAGFSAPLPAPPAGF